MATWKERIQSLRTEFIGKRVEFDNEIYTIADVDYNGIIHIDRATAHNKTTAVYSPQEARNHLV